MKFSKKAKTGEDPFVIQSGKFGQLQDFSFRKSWTEDSFNENVGDGEIVGRTFDLRKTKLVGAVVLFFLMILLGRTAWLQVVEGDYYHSMAEGNRVRIQRIEPKRGVIYDRDLNPLARNKANWLLYFTPIDLPRENSEKDDVILKVSEILASDKEGELNQEMTIEYINEALSKIKLNTLEAYQPLFIADNIPYDKAMQLYLVENQLPGVILDNRTRREYNVYAQSLSHILGYTGKINEDELDKFGEEYLPIDYIGKTGIEYFWENELKGVGGKRHIEVDALGKKNKIIRQTESEDGHNLVLALDLELQKKIEDILNSYLKKFNLSKAAVVAMNPNNGEVLSMVSLPAYDNNVFARGITSKEYAEILAEGDNPLFNRAISGEYPSGSTIKPVMAIAGLSEGIISEWTSFNSVGGIGIGQWFFPDWKAGGHGLTSVRKAIAESVNTFFYYLGGGYEDFVGLGINTMVKYFRLFGLGEQTGIDLAGEVDGFLPSKEWKEKVKGERWYIGDTYHLAIGQGDLLVTPLQVANFTSVFANSGTLYRPRLIKSVLSDDDKVIKEFESEIIRQDFIDPYNMQIIRQGMRQTVTSGSATSLQAVPVSVAGKTGTAQWSSKKSPHTWFTGFAPYDNPEIVITVLVEEGGEASVAVPITKEILTWYFNR